MGAPGPIEDRIGPVMAALPEQCRTLDFRLLGTMDEKHPAVVRRVQEHLEINWEPAMRLRAS